MDTAVRQPGPAPSGLRHRLADRHPVALFLVLSYALSWWPVLGRFGNPESAVVFPVGPSIAGLLMLGWRYRQGRRDLLGSLRQFHLGRWWWTVLIPVGIGFLVAPITVLLGGTPPTGGDLAMALVAFLVLPLTLVVAGPLGEELGWRGYLLPHLLETRSPRRATVVLLPAWLAFHLPLTLTQPGRYGAPWAAVIVGLAFTMTWLHLRTGGSVLLAVVFHAVVNTSAAASIQLFPEADRPLAAGVTAALWLVVGSIVALGPLHQPVEESA